MHSDESIDELARNAPAYVEWWPGESRNTTFAHLLVRVVAETAQHADHAEILRESVVVAAVATTTKWGTPRGGLRT